MALTFANIIEQASEMIQDPTHGLFNGGLVAKKAAVNRVQRRVLLLTSLNRASIIVSFATNVADGVVQANTHATDPTVALIDMNGWNEYEISDMHLLDDIERFLLTGDGRKTKLEKWTPQKAQDDSWLREDGDRVIGYRMPTMRRIRFYPRLTAAGYPFTVEIPYLKLATDMVADSDLPSMPEAFADVLIYAVAAEWCNIMKRSEAANYWDELFRQIVGVGILQKNTDDNNQPTEIQATWKPAF